MHLIGRLLVVVALSVASVASAADDAAAHERRTVGPYQLIVGWLEEPSFVGVTNAASLAVTDTRITPPKPVEGLEKTLTIEIFQGGSTTPFSAPFRARFGSPGTYAADIVPTREGSYRFVIRGKIETLDVNETFESGPGRFDEIRPLTALQYPDKVPAGAGLARALEENRSTGEQVRVIAIVAAILAAAALVLPYIRRSAR